jgi:hypothetical protein
LSATTGGSAMEGGNMSKLTGVDRPDVDEEVLTLGTVPDCFGDKPVLVRAYTRTRFGDRSM